MVDPRAFREEHPSLCPEDLPVPGIDPVREGQPTETEGWSDAYERSLEAVPWDDAPNVRKLMETHGAEAFGHYRSFRTGGETWGIYLHGPSLLGLAREVRRILNLGFVEMEDHVPAEGQREVAFAMAHDIAANHLSFHATVDAFAAEHEVADSRAYYAPYLRGPYARTLKEMEGPSGYNEEEVLGNVVSLRSFLNPTVAVEIGNHIEDHLDEETQFRWNGYLMSGNLTSELTYVMRAYPESHKNFIEFLRRKGEVGPYAHMAIQYDLNQDAFHKGLARLANTLLKGKEVDEPEKALLTPANPPVYLVP